MKTVKAAEAQSSPVFHSREGTVEKVVGLLILTRESGPDIVMDQNAASKESKLLPVHFSGEDGISLPIAQGSSARLPTRLSFRYFGINE